MARRGSWRAAACAAALVAAPACVTRVVVTIPILLPAAFASSSSVVNDFPSPSWLKSFGSVVLSMLRTPELTFSPVIIDDMVPALSGVMWSAV